MTMSWRSGDDPRKGRFEDPRKDSRALNPNILGPIFTSKPILGGFFSTVLDVDFGRIFSAVFDLDFGWFCPRLQFTVKRPACLCFRSIGARF
jgi:hypothetical protein